MARVSDNKMEKPTVIHCLLDGRFGGPQNYALLVSKQLENRYNFLFVSSGKSTFTHYHLTCLRRHFRALFCLDVIINIFELYRFVKNQKLSRGNYIFHIHSYVNLAPLLFAAIFQIPTLFHFHEKVNQPYLFSLLRVFLKYNKVIKLAHVSRNLSKKTGFKEFTLLPCAVETEKCKRPIVKPTTINWPDLSQNSLKVVMVGNLNPVKDHMTVLAALAILRQPVSLCIVGAFLSTQKKYTKLLQNEVKKIQKTNKKIKVHLVGFKKQNVVQSLLEEADVFLLSSKSEACPITVLEARNVGCFIISTNVGDVNRMLKNYENKTLIPVESPNRLVSALNNLNLENVATKTPHQLQDEWSINSVSERLSNVYKSLLNPGLKMGVK